MHTCMILYCAGLSNLNADFLVFDVFEPSGCCTYTVMQCSIHMNVYLHTCTCTRARARAHTHTHTHGDTNAIYSIFYYRTLIAIPAGFILYDGFEPSGRMHIAQGVFKAMNVNKCTRWVSNTYIHTCIHIYIYTHTYVWIQRLYSRRIVDPSLREDSEPQSAQTAYEVRTIHTCMHRHIHTRRLYS